MPADSGVAFVIVQHLDPDHKSMMTDILKRHTQMKVFEVKEAMRIKRNAVYVIPPNQLLSLFNGALHLAKPEPRGLRLPIDSFFRSPAEDKGDKSIAVILSGTGSDGTLGLKAVKEAGGMTMAQEPSSAKYNGMPSNAIATGCVDYILPAEEMPERLARYIKHPYILNVVKSEKSKETVNEELVTVNSELQSKLDELASASNDMLNLLSSTEIATLFLDNNLKVKRFTPAVTEVIDLVSTDIGRSIGGLITYLPDENLVKDAEEVLKKLAFKEKEVKSRHGKWYLTRISPYRTLENMIDGVVIVFINVTEFKKANEALQGALQYAENLIATIREPLLVLNKKLRVVSANAAYYQTFRVGKEETLGQLIYSLGNGQWNIPSLKRVLEEVLSKDTTVQNYEMSHTFEQIGLRTISLNARKVSVGAKVVSEEEEELILVAIQDQTPKG